MGAKSLVHKIILVATQGQSNESAIVVLPLKIILLSTHKDITDCNEESVGRFGWLQIDMEE